MKVGVHGATGRLGRLILEQGGESCVAVPRSGPVPDCDVVIDVSSPDGLAALLPRLTGQPLIVGTTGVLPDLSDYATRAAVTVVPNFSDGVPVLLDLIRQAVARLPDWQIEVVEAHHSAKKDAPSGTAKRMVEAIGRPVPTHSLRAGDTIGEHTVWLAGPGERIELKHVATRREVFAIGALRWAAKMIGQPAGFVKI